MNKEQLLSAYNCEKNMKLIAAILIDCLGFTSYLIPGLGELSDTVIAPLSALLLFAVFKSKKISAFGFAEEILPFTDFIPTGTIFWYRRYVLNHNKTFEAFVKDKAATDQITNKYLIS